MVTRLIFDNADLNLPDVVSMRDKGVSIGKVIAVQVTLPWSILDAQYFRLGDISPTGCF